MDVKEGKLGDKTKDMEHGKGRDEPQNYEVPSSSLGLTTSHDSTVDSTPRPRVHLHNTLLPETPPTSQTKDIIFMVAEMQQQFLDALASQKNDNPDRLHHPHKLVCPTITRFTSDPFVIVRHLYALEDYIDNASLTMGSSTLFDAWVVRQCNLSIAGVGDWRTWSQEKGRYTSNFSAWSRLWKAKVLDRDWVDQVRNSAASRRMAGVTPLQFDAFASSPRDHQNILRDSNDPLDDKEVKRLLMAGLISPFVTHAVKGAWSRQFSDI
ncbi:hypothetical protein L202_01331 [Cryptococcus amylolentus CBS 6039]|uniref:Uncharacterized protein n=1 Tax=Cryptococcus amylolentus CBS 6039 TaxID=1295533 RepID=A0A1E3I5M3_9TREE|nr:hypothetical protein L202_01331 [Cryptococcus amylolentus CBS 6039]ODN83126.1 hypothetical protein L202_01331 [Cryptococcus amylolentus CBS 6039]